jgi:hypothetical protein
MVVTELNQNQIDELKTTYLYDVENNYSYAEEIPNQVIFKHFSGIHFVNDDFVSTANH